MSEDKTRRRIPAAEKAQRELEVAQRKLDRAKERLDRAKESMERHTRAAFEAREVVDQQQKMVTFLADHPALNDGHYGDAQSED